MKLEVLIVVSVALMLVGAKCFAQSQWPANDPRFAYVQRDPVIIAKYKALQDQVDEANTYSEQGDWSDAEKLYKQVLIAWPNNTSVIEALAHHAYLIGDDENAIKLYRQCIYNRGKVYNFNDRSLMELAISLSKHGQMDEALKLYQTSYKCFGDYLTDGSIPVAIPNYSASNPPQSVTEFQAMAHVIAGMDRMPTDPSGEMHLKAATELDPSSPIGYFYLGRWLKETHTRDADAAAAYRRAWEQGDSHVDALVLKEADGAFQPFHKAFDQAFKDIPHHSLGDDSGN